MRKRLRMERSHELMRLSTLYLHSRATSTARGTLTTKRQVYNELMHRTFKLPRPLLQNIASFLPLCPMWNRQLTSLIYETPFQPNRVVQQGLCIIDEILLSIVLDQCGSLRNVLSNENHKNNLLSNNCCKQGTTVGQLALFRDDLSYRRHFFGSLSCQFPMHSEMVLRLYRMADIQGAISSYAAGAAIQFGVEVAQDIVSLLSDVLEWNQARQHAELFG